jgi:hypothetical protein
VHDESRWWRAAPVLAAAAIAVAYLAVHPRTVDLAAAEYRARLFEQAGFTLWDNGWYAGHPTLSYSVLLPPLAALFGPALLGALATVASAALFEPLARGGFGPRAARWGALWFGAGVAATLLSGRIAFALGIPFGLAAALALQRGRPLVACALALLCGLSSPVAGAFLALAAVAYALGGASWRAGLAVAVAAAGPPAALALAFPDGGEAPFAFSAFWPLPLLALGFAFLARDRGLRFGAVLYAVAVSAAYLIGTPMGGAVVRLGALLGAALVLCVFAARREHVALAALLFAGFAFIQWSPAVRDLADSGDRSTEASFYRPLLAFLDRNPGAYRVEIPFTHSHWEAAEVAPRQPIARGWLRPADVEYNAIFYDGSLNEETYRRWLSDNAVRFVAVPDAEPDYSARAELRLIEQRPPYLQPVWSDGDWRVYEVGPRPAMTTTPNLRVTELGPDHVTLRAERAASAVVRVRWTPLWHVDGGCADPEGHWTRVTVRRAGTYRMTPRLTGSGCG